MVTAFGDQTLKLPGYLAFKFAATQDVNRITGRPSQTSKRLPGVGCAARTKSDGRHSRRRPIHVAGNRRTSCDSATARYPSQESRHRTCCSFPWEPGFDTPLGLDKRTHANPPTPWVPPSHLPAVTQWGWSLVGYHTSNYRSSPSVRTSLLPHPHHKKKPRFLEASM